MTKLQFIEPVYVPDVVVSGIAYTEEIAPDLYRISYFNSQVCCLDRSVEHVIVAKFVMHRQNLVAAMRQAMWERHMVGELLVEG